MGQASGIVPAGRQRLRGCHAITRSRSQHETEQLLMFGKRQQRHTKGTAATYASTAYETVRRARKRKGHWHRHPLAQAALEAVAR